MSQRQSVTLLMLATLVLVPTAIASVRTSPIQQGRIYANYDAIRDEPFTLTGVGQAQLFNTVIEEGAQLGGERAVLLFMVQPSSIAGVQVQVQVNGMTLKTYTFYNFPSHGVWEVFSPPNVGLHVGQNMVEFKKTSGTGSVTISDVVLLYRRVD